MQFVHEPALIAAIDVSAHPRAAAILTVARTVRTAPMLCREQASSRILAGLRLPREIAHGQDSHSWGAHPQLEEH